MNSPATRIPLSVGAALLLAVFPHGAKAAPAEPVAETAASCHAAADPEPPSIVAPSSVEHGATMDHSQHRMAAPPSSGQSTTEVIATSGLTIPDFELLDQEGRVVHFYSDLVRDRVVVMNFVFTTCTTICPPMGANFARLQALLGERAADQVELISISVDPLTDTPDRLKAWSERFRSPEDDGPRWTLVTGVKARIDNLLKALKVFTPDSKDHSPIVLVGNDATGQWLRAYGLAPATRLDTLLAEMETPGTASTQRDSTLVRAGGGR